MRRERKPRNETSKKYYEPYEKKKTHYAPWTENEKERLIEYFMNGFTDIQISDAMGKALGGVVDMIKELKREKRIDINRKTLRLINKWTKENVCLMLDMIEKGGKTQDVARALNRNYVDVAQKRTKLKQDKIITKAEYLARLKKEEIEKEKTFIAKDIDTSQYLTFDDFATLKGIKLSQCFFYDYIEHKDRFYVHRDAKFNYKKFLKEMQYNAGAIPLQYLNYDK